MFRWLRRSRDKEIETELQYHLDMLSREAQEEGMSPAEAEIAARRKLGGAVLVRERVRDIWSWPSLEAVAKDLRYAVRVLRKNPLFTLAAVSSLALGLGMTTSIFTLVNSILLHSLPYSDPDRLVMLWSENKEQHWDHEKMSFPEMLDWEKTAIFDRVVGFLPNMGTVTSPGEPELVHAYGVTPGALPMLGVRPMIGRAFTPDEERRGGARAVILRHNIWQRLYGGDPKAIGRTMLFNDTPLVIVGVMPPGFEFFNRESDLILPAYLDPQRVTTRFRLLRVMARLKSGLSLRDAQTRANVIAANFARQYPQFNRGWTVNLVPFPVDTAGPVRPALLVLMGAVGLVMLIACSNVASLLLAQAGARSKEISVRLALGASRGCVARQMMLESLLLASCGGAAGLLLAYFVVQYFRSTLPDRFSAGRFMLQLDQIRLDPSVVLFSVLMVLASALLFGLVPAWRTSKADVNEGLKDASRGGSSSLPTRRAQRALVVAQVAVAVVLAIAAGLLIQSFARLYQQGPGFRAENLKTADILLPSFELQNASRDDMRAWVRTNYDLVMDRVAALPGIEAVTSVNDLPLSGFYLLNEFTIENRAERDPGDHVRAIDHYVWPAYFETMGIPLLSGRYFNRLDGEQQPRVAVVNDAFVRHYLAGVNPIGRRVKFGASNSNGPWHSIVGVVGGERAGGMDEEPRPMIYLSTSQYAQSIFHLIVRSRMDLATTMSAIRAALHKINPKIAPYAPTTFDTVVLDSTWRVRYSMLLLTVLAVVSLVVSVVGVYGVISYGVSERTSEIGIRLALGARTSNVVGMITREGMRLALAGVALGLVSAAALMRLLSSLLFGVRAIDWATYAAVAGILLAAAALATFLPARRAARLDPTSALRHE